MRGDPKNRLPLHPIYLLDDLISRTLLRYRVAAAVGCLKPYSPNKIPS